MIRVLNSSKVGRFKNRGEAATVLAPACAVLAHLQQTGNALWLGFMSISLINKSMLTVDIGVPLVV